MSNTQFSCKVTRSPFSCRSSSSCVGIEIDGWIWSEPIWHLVQRVFGICINRQDTSSKKSLVILLLYIRPVFSMISLWNWLQQILSYLIMNVHYNGSTLSVIVVRLLTEHILRVSLHLSCVYTCQSPLIRKRCDKQHTVTFYGYQSEPSVWFAISYIHILRRDIAQSGKVY